MTDVLDNRRYHKAMNTLTKATGIDEDDRLDLIALVGELREEVDGLRHFARNVANLAASALPEETR